MTDDRAYPCARCGGGLTRPPNGRPPKYCADCRPQVIREQRAANRDTYRPVGTGGRGSVKLTAYPDLVREWHPDNDRQPGDIAAGSSRRVRWRCARGHEWAATVANRTGLGTGCPFCAGTRPAPGATLADRFPAIAAELDSTASGVTADTLAPRSAKRVWWICAADRTHRWEQTVNARTRATGPSGCPYCRNYMVMPDRSLAARYPEVAAELDEAASGVRAVELAPRTSRRVHWQCARDPSHTWTTTVLSRTAQGTGCPFCRSRGGRQRVTPEDALSSTHPELAAEWSPTNRRDVSEVGAGSGYLAEWVCMANATHTWTARVYSRTRPQSASSHGCPFCANRIIDTTNSLAAVNPELAAQWCDARNGTLRPDRVGPGARRSVWWTCPADPSHQWRAAIYKRSAGGGCPWCIVARRSLTEIRLAHELAALLPVDLEDHKVADVHGRPLSVDIVVRPLHLAIEFDGAYWHGQDVGGRDRRKTSRLMEAGWGVVRLREAPLRRVGANDVLVRKAATVKELADATIERLLELGYDVPGADRYLGQDGPVAARAANRYIQRLQRHAARQRADAST